MIRTIHKIYMLLIGISLFCVTPLTAQELYQQFEKGKYSKILETLESNSHSQVSYPGDLKACATVAVWSEKYKLACKYYQKLEKTDSTAMESNDYFNYAYSLLEIGDEEKLMNLNEDDKWVKHVQDIVEFRRNVKLKESFKTEKIDLKNFIYDYGITYDDDKVYFAASQYPYEESNNLENTKLNRRWAEFATIKSFDIVDYNQEDIEGEILKSLDIKDRTRLVTGCKDSSGESIFYTMVPRNGKPEQIVIDGNYPEFPYNSPKYACAMPWYDAANSKLYFCSDIPGGIGGWDIYSCTLDGDKWEDPVNEEILNTPLDELFPHGSPWGMIFASNAGKGLGGFDNYLYSNKTSNIVNLLEFNTDNDDYSLEVVMKLKELVAIGVSDTELFAYINSSDTDIDELELKYGDDGIAYLLPKNAPVLESDFDAQDIEESMMDSITPINLDLALYYGMNQYKLTERNKEKINEFIEKLKHYVSEGSTVPITGSADGVGTVKYNDYISYQRASTLTKYLEDNMGDFEITFKQVILGQLSDSQTDNVSLRKSKSIMPMVFPKSENIFFKFRNTQELTFEEIADIFHNDLEELKGMNEEISGKNVKAEVFVAIRTIIRVPKGRTLYSIANEYNCKVDDLIKINKKKNSQVKEREVLIIPIEKKNKNK